MNTVVVFVVIYVLAYLFGRKARFAVDYVSAGAHVHSATQYACASMHIGKLSPRFIIDRLQDRHRAKLPELGFNTGRLLSEARRAQRRTLAFAIITLVVPLWFFAVLVSWVAWIPRVLQGETVGSVAMIQELIYPMLLMTLIGFVRAVEVNSYLRRRILPLNDPPDHDEKQNVSVYGGFSPFAGYGDDQDGWSFATDIVKPAETGGRAQAFEQVDLLDHVTRRLVDNHVMGDASDRLFISGVRIRHKPLFLHDVKAIPNTALSARLMRARIGLPDKDEGRHYRVFCTPFGNGNLYLTHFFRSIQVGDKMYVELRRFLLTPIQLYYTELNELPARTGFVYHLELLARQLSLSPFSWWYAPWLLAAEVSRLWAKLLRNLFGDPEDARKVRQETYNYGHDRSLREILASRLFSSYFQKLDLDMITKTCQHVIVDAIVEFLKARGISTEDIEESRTQIFNSGLIMHGGVVNARQMAIGEKASFGEKASVGEKAARRLERSSSGRSKS